MTSYLDTNKILWSPTFSENLVKIRRDDVTWRHVTLFLQILIKKVLKVLEICWCQQKICQIGTLFIIFLKSHYNSFQERGQPCFYHQWFNFYNVWHESPDFRRFLLISYTKMLTSAKFWPDIAKTLYFSKVQIIFYNWSNF